MTKGELEAAWAGLPDDTHLEIHVPGKLADYNADYEIVAVGVVIGSRNPTWFTLKVGEFITNC